MPRFAANLTMLFTELPFLERFAAAADAGFEAVEFLFPYDFEAGRVADAIAAARLKLVLHNLPAGDWGAGERGIACDPARTGEFQDGVGRAIRYAKALGCPRLNCLVGIPPPGQDASVSRETMIGNLGFAARALREAGVAMVMEPVNTRDVPGFFVNQTPPALAVLDAVGSDNLTLQYDIYHAQVMEGDLERTIATHLARIGHLQVAGNPGRHEQDTGEINYPYLFERIDALGYDGWIGCEYKPAADTASGLGWLAKARTSSR